MTATAVSEVSTDAFLPRISNGKFLVHKEPLFYSGQPFISLPPLPKYTSQGTVRKRWGEDESIDRMGFSSANSGYAKYRNNVLTCHTVPEEPGRFKYEGCMFSKPLYQDLMMLHRSATSTNRRVPRQPTLEMFPRNDKQRLSCHDGEPVLCEATRKAIEDNVTSLYKNSHYDIHFKDTSRFMLDKAKRDALYHLENPSHTDSPTCSRVYGHPDPCRHCWCGGYNTDFEAKLAKYQSRQHGSSNGCYGNTGMFSQTDKHGNDHEVHNSLLADVQVEGCDCLKNSCRICCHKAVDLNDENSSKDSQCNEELSRNHGTHKNRIDKHLKVDGSFGPWQKQVQEDQSVKEDTLFANDHQLKLSSAVHCPSTDNELAFDWASRHYYLIHNKLSLDSWRSLCKAKTTGVNCSISKEAPSMEDQQLETDITVPHSVISQTTRNSWTNRDRNNLRIQCIAKVLGNLDKSDAHKRFHIQYPEPIPDLRDHRRYSRRVTFFGFNSSVFR